MSNAPLNDPSYKPEHPPVNGRIPEVVKRFGMATQLRWFRWFWKELRVLNDYSGYYVSSEHHLGLCCMPCTGEFVDGHHGGGVIADGWCCCRDSRINRKPTEGKT